jgi:hypothetical protein
MPLRLPLLALALAPLPLLACKPAPRSAPLAPTASTATPIADPTTTTTTPLPPPSATVYGYFRSASATTLLTQLRTVLPPAQSVTLDETFLRTMAGSLLGERSAVAGHVDLTRPLGCVVTSPKRHDRPFTCVFAYTGGFTSLVKDLGPSGYVSGADDYAAYRFDGKPVYLAAMDGHVAIAFAPDLIAATRDRLQRDIIDTPAGDDDFVARVYPSVIFDDARDEIDVMLGALPQPPSASPIAEAGVAAQRKQWLSWAELEHADLWLDIQADRIRLGYRGTARPGTATERAYATSSTLGHDRELLAQLPANALVVGGMHMDLAAISDDPMLGATMQAFGSLCGTEAAVAEQYREGLRAWTELSTGQLAVALLHERGTTGGVVMTYRLKPDVDARTRLRKIFEGYQVPAAMSRLYRMELRPGAFRAGKLRGDVLTMKPTAELLSQPGGAGLTRVLGDPPRLHMAYVQHGDLLHMAMAPGKAADRYLRRVLASASGERPLGAREDAQALLDAHRGDTWMVAGSVQAILTWLIAIDAIRPPPIILPERLDDVVLTLRPAGERQREVVVELSSAVVQALIQLATI